MNKYNAALIGCGRISGKHIEAYAANNSHIALAALCDPETDRAVKQKTEYDKLCGKNNAKIFSDYREMLKEIKPDFVSIASESGKHAEIAINCLNSGVHVICEKPMALSTSDADKMIEAARSNNKKLAVCFQNRFNAPVIRLRNAMEAGRLGRILHGMVQIRWNRNPAYYAEAPWRGTWAQDGGTLMNQCTHGIDLLQWMMGEDAIRVQAQTRRFIRPIEAEDFGAAIVEFKSGAVGIIEGTADVFPKNLNETLSVFGEKGTAVIGGLAVNKMETWRLEDASTHGDTEEEVLKTNTEDPPTVYGYGHNALFYDFADSIVNNREPAINGEAGKKALEIILAIYKSQKTGKAVELPCDFSTNEMEAYFDK